MRTRQLNRAPDTRPFGLGMYADWTGIAASTACAVHCMLLPVLLLTGTILPVSFLNDESFHTAMLWLILPTAIVAFGIGCWQHRDRRVLVLGAVGLTGMVLSATIAHDLIGEAGERIATVLSAGILVSAHFRNFRLCRKTSCDHQ